MADKIPAATLLRILKAEGCVISTPYSDWATYQRDEETGKSFGPVNGVIIHHTASHDSRDYLRSGSSRLPGPLCHCYIKKNGVIEMMSAGRANHAGGGDPDVLNAVITESYMTRPPAPKFHEDSDGAADGNDHFYGFECENLGTGTDPWPDVQYVAMVKAAAAICRYYGWSSKSVIGHLEWSDWKQDPKGFGMVTFRADVAACLRAAPGTWPSTPPPPEDNVSLPESDIKAIGVQVVTGANGMKSPDDPAVQWAVSSYLGLTYKMVRSLQADVDALQVKVDEILTKLNGQ